MKNVKPGPRPSANSVKMELLPSALGVLVAKRLKELNRNPFEVARAMGEKNSFINDLKIGRKQTLRADSVPALARELKLPAEVLMTANRKSRKNSTHNLSSDQKEKQQLTLINSIEDTNIEKILTKYFIPEFNNNTPAPLARIQNSTETGDRGHDPSAEEDGRAKWLIPGGFLNGLGIYVENTRIYQIEENSMVPVLAVEDRVVVDLNNRDPRMDGIFAIYHGPRQRVIFKNVQVLSDETPQRILCSSSNKDYPAFELVLDDTSYIIGRVRLRMTPL